MNEEVRKQVYALLQINEDGEWLGGVQRFTHIPYDHIKEIGELLGEEFLKSAQNFSPTVEEFLEYTEEFENQTLFHGYVVCKERDDERVTIEGVLTSRDDSLIGAFRHADVFNLDSDSLYVWWD